MGKAGLEGGSYRIFFFCGSLGTVRPTLVTVSCPHCRAGWRSESNSQAVTADHHGCF